ncbi:MAG: hypothetical protein H0V81_05395 [Solirubrobacterales bacterium]|nr:hypothetical protein [Solirubrobacterales bacterium]
MPSAPSVRVTFDESHSQAWTIRRELAAEMQPTRPGDVSYADAAGRLRARGFAVSAHTEGRFDADVLAGADVLVIAHPSEPRWERTVPGGASPCLTADELDAVEAWVRAGGGLIVLGETEQEKYGNNLDALTQRFGIGIETATVADYEQHHDSPHWIRAELRAERSGVDPLARVEEVCFYRAGTLAVDDRATVLAVASPTSTDPGAPLLAVTRAGAGRVVVAADSDLFSDDCLADFDHAALWENLVTWVGQAAFAMPLVEPVSAAASDAHWHRLKAETDTLRLRQRPDGSVDLAVHPPDELDAHVAAICAAVEGLAPHFGHQAEYLAAVRADLAAWAGRGFGVPDFTGGLDAFRPDLRREDGIEHLVVFPMSKQNGSRDRVFEALLVRVPWPEWLAGLEAGDYDNAKFVPVTLTDHTAGYDSECAVLFPETVSVAGPPANHFGAIFCDREAERFRRTVSAAAETLRVNLPPDAAALLVSEPLSRDAYELWDLVHDRTHSHGDLPFDPFMIRQRAPYWMYALEELRCDLTAFAEAARLEASGFGPVARHAQYAILFDRLFRFPVTGERVRNYDGLGGQLLFAFLHRTERIHWTDNRLTIDWAQVTDGVLELRGLVEELYRAGIDRTKVAHWSAAHDLVAAYVSPAAGSRWAAPVRAFPDAEDPRAYVDEVLSDEFPLSIFYSSLRKNLAPVIERTPTPA